VGGWRAAVGYGCYGCVMDEGGEVLNEFCNFYLPITEE
jgi:hypothetical protein